MPKRMEPAVRRQLELDVAAIDRGYVPPRPAVNYERPPAVEPPPAEAWPQPAPPEGFGRWLLTQRDRGDWIDQLAAAARADRGFPKDADVGAVHARLILNGADPDMFEQLDDAERCWRAQ